MAIVAEIKEAVAEIFTEMATPDANNEKATETVVFSRPSTTYTTYDPVTNTYTTGSPTTIPNIEVILLNNQRLDRENTPLTVKQVWILVEAVKLGTFVPRPGDTVKRGTVDWRVKDMFDPTGAIQALYKMLIELP